MLLEFFVILLEVVVDSAWLLLMDETLLDHVLAPHGMRSVHSNKSFSCCLVNIFDKLPLKVFKELQITIEELYFAKGCHEMSTVKRL